MKKRLAFINSVFIVLILILSYNVVTTGKASQSLYVGGFGEGNFSSINSALKAAQGSDFIFVCPGEYNEKVVINKSIHLIGSSQNETIIDGSDNYCCVNIISSNVTFSNFSLKNSSIALLISKNQRNIKIKHNSFCNNTNGILANENTSNINISSNLFYNNSEGSRFYNCSSSTISNNSFIDNLKNSIIFRNKSNFNNICKNSIFNCSVGIHNVDFSNNNVIKNNNISNNHHGIYGKFCENIFIYKNFLSNNSGNAIYLYDSGFFNISNNSIISNEYGVYINSCYNYSESYTENNIFMENTHNTKVTYKPPVIKLPSSEMTVLIIFLFLSFIVFYMVLKKYRK